MPVQNKSGIPFTQYLLPDGRQREVFIDRPEKIEAQAQLIIKRGLRFECEMLTDGEVSLTIHDPKKGEDIAIEIVPNGTEVPKAVDRLVERNSIPEAQS